MGKANDVVKEESVISILDERKNLVGIYWMNQDGEMVLYHTEKVGRGEMKEFLASLVSRKNAPAEPKE